MFDLKKNIKKIFLLSLILILTACKPGSELEAEFTPKAKNGDVEAQYRLGRLYIEGQGVAPSEKRGMLWIKRAAEGGLAIAQNDMGVMYAEGAIVRKDWVQAAKWLILSGEKNDYGPAQTYWKDNIRDNISAEDLKKARELVDKWQVNVYKEEVEEKTDKKAEKK